MAMQAQSSDADLEYHAETYHRFMLAVKWFAVHFAALASFFTLWFATSAGFVAALFVGVVVFAVGAYAMTHGLGHSSEPHPPRV